MTEWISIPEFAKRELKSPQYIRRLIRDGKITETAVRQKGKRFLINPKQAIADLAANTSYMNKRPAVEHLEKEKQNETVSDYKKESVINSAGLKIVSLAEAQKLQANYIAALKKIDLEERQGDVLQKTDVEQDAFNIARRTRDAILNIPDRISAELASATDTHVINSKLTKELIQALEELSS